MRSLWRQKSALTGAHAIGGGDLRILVRHVLPNVLAPVVIIASLYLGRRNVLDPRLRSV